MKELRRHIESLGPDLYGFADLGAIPEEDRQGLPFGVSMALALTPSIAVRIPREIPVEYSGEYHRLNDALNAMADSVAEFLAARGYRAVPQTVSYVWDQVAETKAGDVPGHALVPHKTVAALAGLGWIGKSTLLVTRQYGSAQRLTSVLTDAPLEALRAEYACRCGSCSVCADACPAHAIRNTTWAPGVGRDQLIDYNACQEHHKLRGRVIDRTGGTCGICMAVCPHTQRYLRAAQ